MSNKIIRGKLKKLVASAKKRNIYVNIKIEAYGRWLETGCGYCGIDVMKDNGYSLDRKDNTKGYTEDNIVVCCYTCNRTKGTMSQAEYFQYIDRAYNHHKKLLEHADLKYLKKYKNIEQNRAAYKNSKSIVIDGDRK